MLMAGLGAGDDLYVAAICNYRTDFNDILYNYIPSLDSSSSPTTMSTKQQKPTLKFKIKCYHIDRGIRQRYPDNHERDRTPTKTYTHLAICYVDVHTWEFVTAATAATVSNNNNNDTNTNSNTTTTTTTTTNAIEKIQYQIKDCFEQLKQQQQQLLQQQQHPNRSKQQRRYHYVQIHFNQHSHEHLGKGRGIRKLKFTNPTDGDTTLQETREIFRIRHKKDGK